MATNTTKVIIKKLGGERTNIARVCSEADIPAELKNSIVINGGKIELATCKEGKEVCDLGLYVAWEKSDKSPTGWNCWCKTNGFDTIDEVNGRYFERTQPVQAQVIVFGDSIPDFMSGATIDTEEDGTVHLTAEWGVQTAHPGEKYMYLAYQDGTFALLDLESNSAGQYYICDESGKLTEQKLVDWVC